MAATTVKPYPHVQINVKDNSIANVQTLEVLPVHRPLYVMRTQEGPVGDPKWCNTYSEAVAKFGAETFNPTNEIYFSRSAQFLLNTMTYNGAFITRYLPSDATTAQCILFAQVKKLEAAFQQYEYQNGQRKLVFVNNEWQYVKKTDEYGTEIKEDGVAVAFGVRVAAAGEDLENLKPMSVGDGVYQFPLFVFNAKYAGAYGNDIAFKLFYSARSNDSADVSSYGTLFYNIGFARREYNSTTVNAITDIYGRDNMSFAANPETVNPDSGAYMGVDAVLDKGFSDDAHQLPLDFLPYDVNFACIGNIIAAFESDDSINGYDTAKPVGTLTADEKAAVKAVYFGTATDEQKAIVAALTFGFKVNGVSCEGITGIPYDHAAIDNSILVGNLTAVTLNDSSNQFMVEGSGSDGTFVADDAHAAVGTSGEYQWSSDDRAMYDFCKLNLNKTIVESLHYPFTHIFDIGFSIKTKKAILDFLDVRDDFMAILSTQVLMTDGSGRAVPMAANGTTDVGGYTVNDQASDEAALETLRSYALLMRESVLFGTDCMRAAIYCHTGILAAGTYTKPVPFTYWSAIQYAQYGNVSYMKTSEPRGLPNSYNLLFKEWNWNNYNAAAQSRVWDNGGNYVQYADMTRLFYPALRTVYRASTSVLVDEWFVAAVVYAKYVCKHAWATFSGRNDSAAVLQGAIKQYLDKELAALFNNKYTFETSVYQTADEQEVGYIQHVKLSITSPATMRVLDVDIEVNREGFVAEE